jgi:hypothetical protein
MAVANPTLSYPKPRSIQTKIVPILRTDSSTLKCILPKDAIVINVHCIQKVNAGTNPATWTLGWAGATSAILNAFSAPVSGVGLVNPGAAAGSGLYTKLDTDKAVIATFGGTSVSGGTGYVAIDYFVAGPGEEVDD